MTDTKKGNYMVPEADIMLFSETDVITASVGSGNEDDLPVD